MRRVGKQSREAVILVRQKIGVKTDRIRLATSFTTGVVVVVPDPNNGMRYITISLDSF